MQRENFANPETKKYSNREINIHLLQKAIFLALNRKANGSLENYDKQTHTALSFLNEMSLATGVVIRDWNSLMQAYTKLYIEGIPENNEILDVMMEAIESLDVLKSVRSRISEATEIDL